jgi:ABC-2 type transport system permease protein
MKLNVVQAIFRRNFISYFSNPTGYVFICVFVLLSGFAAFWPNEFFNANLANLDQLNRYLPFIMLVFIPAITMSIWADERRLGTDELLLTIPATDLEVVIGKYLAAVAIFSVALLFSLSNVLVLMWLGSPDFGLLFGTYLGYWLVGLAMLAIGMVASFLTANLTVGFILGVAFNAPLVFADSADVILPTSWAINVKHWSLAEQFRDFGHGVISLSSVVYFLSIVGVMLYLSMVLIGRRHWRGGRDGQSLLGHYLARSLALVVLAVGLSLLVLHFDRRLDVSYERLSSLSPQTTSMLRQLKRPVQVEAFISPQVPETYVRTRLDLLAMLREFERRSGGKVRLRVNETEPYSAAAQRAEEQYGIKSQQVASRTRGAMNIEEIYLGVAFTSGLEKVVVPFFDRGVPVEYELIRSIGTVAGEKRKRLGLLVTDAKLQGEFDMQTMSPGRKELIVEELEKQYEVVPVNADSPINERYDVLLAVQPSSLSEEQMHNFVAAVRAGQPTAIFEDPFPYLDPNVPATSAPKRPQGGMPFQQTPPQPKGNIGELWALLGIDFSDSSVVWQQYNPYPKISAFPPEFVFVDSGCSNQPFNEEDVISSKLQQLLFLFPGSVRQQNASKLKFRPLVMTGDATGTVGYSDILLPSLFGMGGGQLNPNRRWRRTSESYVLAAHITGKPGPATATSPHQFGAANLPMADEGSPAKAEEAEAAATSEGQPATTAGAAAAGGDKPASEAASPTKTAETKAAESKAAEVKAEGSPAAETKASEPQAAPPKADEKKGEEKKAEPPKEAELNVVLVSDIDVLYSAFVALRNRGDDPEAEVKLDVDNVTFVLNSLDALAGETRFVEVRKRRPKHHGLTNLDRRTEQIREKATAEREKFAEDFEKEREKAQSDLDKKIAEMKKRSDINPLQMLQEVEMVRRTEERRLEARTEQLKRERDEKIKVVERDLALQVRRVQNRTKLAAVAIPPILPLAFGAYVFVRRRQQEREGVSRQRLR